MRCNRDTNDVLARKFLDRYRVNVLVMPGRRVHCGSVYIQQGGRFTSPGEVADLLEPAVTLGEPFVEDILPDLSGTWSDAFTASLGIQLLENFLTALGAVGAIHELKASVKQSNARKVAFKFDSVSRESLSPIAIGTALVDHRLVTTNPWVQDGNRYYVVAAVLRSASLSVQGWDERDSAVDLGVGVATVVDADGAFEVKKRGTDELSYSGHEALAIGVELYELRWDEDRGQLTFHTQRGPIAVNGLEEFDPPEPSLLGKDLFLAASESP
jgi:hypothetical protein